MWRSLKRIERNECTRGGSTLELTFPKHLFIFCGCIPPLFLLTTSSLNLSYSSAVQPPGFFLGQERQKHDCFVLQKVSGQSCEGRLTATNAGVNKELKAAFKHQKEEVDDKHMLSGGSHHFFSRGRERGKSEINIQGWVGVWRSVRASDTGRSRKMILRLVSDTWKWLFTNIPYKEVWLTVFIHLNVAWNPTNLSKITFLIKKTARASLNGMNCTDIFHNQEQQSGENERTIYFQVEQEWLLIQ